MHLIGPWMTTTQYNRKSKKNKTERQLQAEREHDAWLRKRGLAPDQLKAKLPHDAKGRRQGVAEMPNYKTDKVTVGLSNTVGNGFKRKSNTYTGTEIAGIATMHKSNAVPVRKGTNEAKDIANMRR